MKMTGCYKDINSDS